MRLFRPARFLFLGTLLSTLPLLASCGSAGDAVASVLVSENDEVRLGAQFDAQLRATPGVRFYDTTQPRHARVAAYVDSVVHAVLGRVKDSERPSYYGAFKVALIDSNAINAFAVPGGYVYIYTGILDSLRSEAELAAVLGHELTHVVHHHYRDQLAKQYGVAFVVHALGGDSSALAGLATSLLSLRFSRDDEADADRGGTDLAGAAGYYPLGVADFFSRMPDAGLEILSDHPDNADRVKAVTAQVKSSPTLSALAWTDAAKTVARTDDQYIERYRAMRAQLR